ncbi:hypothetical protein IX308_000440 [Porphyromonas levii]|uniref:hypothetical protein n=1 Tax=Porphyromonas levii TaxID=28114 RepID=UPI001BADEC2D|nr:hypothetical protein [Porphyromonas levii]MBR8784271.1 hypothetical protein [Porphyromonas levii]
MALEKEIWLNDVVEGLFPDDSFVSKSRDDSEYVNGKKVHIPNAGAPSGVEENRSSLPAAVNERTDYDVEYAMSEFTTNPIRISHADTVQLSYNKRNSVIASDKKELHRKAHESILRKWAPVGDDDRIVKTTGVPVEAHAPKATGKRKAFTKNDLKKVFTRMNVDDVPADGRYVLVDAIMYDQFIDSLTAKESAAFFTAVDVKKGVCGELYGIKVMMRSTVLFYSGNNLSTVAGADDSAAALAWHEDAVSRARGEVKMYGDEDSPTYYGDVYSFLLRAGGSKRRHDKKGVYAIVQDSEE